MDFEVSSLAFACFYCFLFEGLLLILVNLLLPFSLVGHIIFPIVASTFGLLAWGVGYAMASD